MPEAKLYRFDALEADPETIEVPAELFAAPVNEDLLHRAVRVYLMNQRQGTAATRTRGEVAGGGRKPWRQKGTGRARHGSTRSPIWRTGGVTFGPRPFKVRLKLPKRMRRRAFVSALSARYAEGTVRLIDRIGFAEPRTKDGIALLAKLSFPRKVLILVGEEECGVPLMRSFSNIPGVTCARARAANTYEVLLHDALLITTSALEELKRRLGDGG